MGVLNIYFVGALFMETGRNGTAGVVHWLSSVLQQIYVAQVSPSFRKNLLLCLHGERVLCPEGGRTRFL